MTKHKLKRAYEKAGFKVGFLPEESNRFPASVRDLDGNKIDLNHPRWSQVVEIYHKNVCH
jgi:hypothetical protein